MAMDSKSAEVAATQPVREDLDGPYKAYNLDLKARRGGCRPAKPESLHVHTPGRGRARAYRHARRRGPRCRAAHAQCRAAAA